MKQIRVSAAIIHENGKIFTTRRSKGAFKGGWEFPGGKREAGESGEDAAIREIKEELQTEIRIEKLLCTVSYQYPDFFMTMDCYLAHVISGNLTLCEHDDKRWLEISEIDSVSWLPADLLVVEEIKKHFTEKH